MIGAKCGYLTIVSFSHWEKNSSFWNCKCLCGKEVKIDRRRLACRERSRYKSCGCLVDCKSKPFYLRTRRTFFNKIKKEGDHWIYSCSSRQKKPMVRAFNKYFTAQKLAFFFLKKINPLNHFTGFWIGNTCGKRDCVSPAHLRVLTPKEHHKLIMENYIKKHGKHWQTTHGKYASYKKL